MKFRIAALLCMITAMNASATLIAYTDRTAWENAVNGNYVLEDFSSAPTGEYFSSPIDVGDFTVNLTGTNFGASWHAIGTGGSNNFSGTNELQIATVDDGFTTLAFDAPIYALGADFGSVSNGRTSSFMIGGLQLDIPDITSGFFGFVSDTSFTSAAMTLTSGGADGYSMDNLVYSTVQVPEPSSLALLGLAMVGLSLRGRKRA